MKRLLSSKPKMWHLLVVAVMFVVLGTAGVVAAQRPGPQQHEGKKVDPEKAEAFFPPGQFLMTASSKNDSVTVAPGAGEVEVARATFTVPDGKRADIAAFFNAEAYKDANGYCYAELHLDTIGSTALKPGELWVADGYVYTGAYPTLNFQGFKKAVSSGPHTLYVTLEATSANCYVYDRSLIVFANQR